MASKVRKVELLCDILEAKKIKCFKGEHNLLCQYFIEVETQSSKYKSSETATWTTTWFLSWHDTCWSENVLGQFAICVLCIIILFPVFFLPWELYVSVASEQWFCQFLTYRENRRNSEVKWKLLSCVRLFVTPWTVAHQAPLSMEFSSQEYWSG